MNSERPEPTPEDQARARRARVAEVLGTHPDRLQQEHADEIFDHLYNPAWLAGFFQALERER